MTRVIPLMLLLALPTAASAFDAACKPFVAALDKTAAQPSRHTVVEVEGSRIELIRIGTDSYTAINGQWRKMPGQSVAPEKTLATAIRDGSLPIQGCAKAGTQVVEGVATTRFRYSLQGLDGKFAQAEAFIGKDGLIHAQSGEGTRQRTRFAGVTAPKL